MTAGRVLVYQVISMPRSGRSCSQQMLRVTSRPQTTLLRTDITVWCAMGIAHFRRIDRRRMVRVSLCVPLTVQQETETQETFPLRATALSVNGGGALFQLCSVWS